ncbi:hypothetical protein [Corynebacterium epidermidicanis]|uniref:Uncharacterized protein n=1 Tax=Corynebacterium epidermidicanis TaxID=1050174 RepID=A0A0G3GVZ1_9CORY|nr:hypothetical protein [Corynebacterium epidermidicanis]AKK03042.1 hypothetical protein CEPID_05890 [Corynebacterium epidermidicanis]
MQRLNELTWVIGELENHFDSLATQPILLQTVTDISYSHLQTLEAAYVEVPDIARRQANAELERSLDLLNSEARKILAAIVHQKFKGLGNQRALLEHHVSGVQLYLDDNPAGEEAPGPGGSTRPSAS